MSVQGLRIEIETGEAGMAKAAAFLQKSPAEANLKASDTYLLAYLGEEPVGVCRHSDEDGFSTLRGMVVKESYQRRRIGSALLESFDSFVRQQPVQDVYCLPFFYLESFYGQIGFARIKEVTAPANLQERLKGYRNKRSDAGFMIMKLI